MTQAMNEVWLACSSSTEHRSRHRLSIDAIGVSLRDPRLAFTQHSDVEGHTEVVVALGHSLEAGHFLNMPFFKCKSARVTSPCIHTLHSKDKTTMGFKTASAGAAGPSWQFIRACTAPVVSLYPRATLADCGEAGSAQFVFQNSRSLPAI